MCSSRVTAGVDFLNIDYAACSHEVRSLVDTYGEVATGPVVDARGPGNSNFGEAAVSPRA